MQGTVCMLGLGGGVAGAGGVREVGKLPETLN